MDKTEVEFWNRWNSDHREHDQGTVSKRQAAVIHRWLRGDQNLSILDAGCGTGWFTEQLVAFGQVVGTDLADEVVERAAARVPAARFLVGDIMTVDVGREFDVVVSLEVLSHVADQAAFLRQLASLLAVGGRLMLATQNRPVLAHFNRIAPPAPGQRRHWVNRKELGQLLQQAGLRPVQILTVSPQADHGPMRALAKLGRVLKASSVLERLGFGWTIMVVAVKPPN